MSNLQSLWSEMLGEANGTSSGYLLRLIKSHCGCRTFAAVQLPERMKGVVIGVPRSALGKCEFPPESPAFRCVAADVDGIGPDQCGLVITLLDDAYEHIFAVFADDIVTAAASEQNAGRVISAILRSIEKWRRFFRSAGLAVLEETAVRGLIGELAVLARVIGIHGAKMGVRAWTGPEDGLHDFALGEMALEVKTHTGNPGGGLWVNDLAQLQPSAGAALNLVAVCVYQSRDGGLTLPQYVDRLRSLLADDSASDVLTMKLAAVGYLDSFAHHYATAFTIGELSVFSVGEGFPAIRPDLVPPAVDKVRYRLRLSHLSPWMVDAVRTIGRGNSPWGTP